MNAIRRVAALLLALPLVVFALPSMAQQRDKIYSLTVSDTAGGSTSSVAYGTPKTLWVTIKNEAPPTANSSYKSFTVTAPAELNITGCARVSSGGQFSPSCSSFPSGGVQTIKVTNLSPVRPQESWTFKLTVATKSDPTSCGSADSSAWGAVVYPGSSADSAETFAPINFPVVTSLSAGCALRWKYQPNNALSGVPIRNTPYNNPAGVPVEVEAVLASGTTTSLDGRTVSLALTRVDTGAPETLSGGSETISGTSATFPNLSRTGAGKYTLKASTTTADGTSVTSPDSNSFDIGAVEAAKLKCGDGDAGTTGDTFTSTDGDFTVTGARSKYNQYGSNCVEMTIAAITKISSDNKFSFIWDTTSQPDAAVTYATFFKDEVVDRVTGLPALKTLVAWDLKSDGTPRFVPGKACWSDAFPAPYGTLKNTLSSDDTKIEIDTTDNAVTLPVATNFPIFIGTERMTANCPAATPTTCTVTRPANRYGTQPITLATAKSEGWKVMSTPAPIDNDPSSYYYTQQMQVCIRFERFNVVDYTACADDATKTCARVEVEASFFDIGDGYVSRGTF